MSASESSKRLVLAWVARNRLNAEILASKEALIEALAVLLDEVRATERIGAASAFIAMGDPPRGLQ